MRVRFGVLGESDEQAMDIADTRRGQCDLWRN